MHSFSCPCAFRANRYVNARIGIFRDGNADAYTDVGVDAGVSRILQKPTKTITIESRQEQPPLEQHRQQPRQEPRSVRSPPLEELADDANADLSNPLPGGVIGDSTAFRSQSKGHHNRNRRLYQEWARNEKGGLKWWLWLIIALVLVAPAVFLVLCCFHGFIFGVITFCRKR